MGDVLPGHLYGTFRTYKADTDFCAQWLVGKAKLAGYDVDSYIYHQQPVNNTASHQTLPTQQFQLLASFIAQQKPKVQVPAEFMRRLRNAISARRVCAAWHRDSQDSAVQKQNTTHGHFIDILESVLNLFKSKHQPQARVSKAKPRTGVPQPLSGNTASQNTFDALAAQTAEINIHQNRPISALGDAQVFAKNAGNVQGGASNIKVTLEEPALDESKIPVFACHCLMTDLHQLRAYNLAMWQNVPKGKTTRLVASLMTNITIDFASRLIEDFWNDIGEAESYIDILVNCFAYCIKPTENDLQPGHLMKPLLSDSSEGLAKSTFIPDDPVEFVFLPAWSDVTKFLVEVDKLWPCSHETHQTERRSPPPEATIPNDSGPPDLCYNGNAQMRERWVRECTQCACEGLLSLIERVPGLKNREDHLSLLRIAFGKALDVPSRAVDHHPTIEDQVLRLLRCSSRTGRVELNVSFAVQLFLDVSESFSNSNQADHLLALDESLKTVVLKADLHCAYWSKIGRWWYRVRDLPKERHPQAWHTLSKALCQHVLENKPSHTQHLEVQDDIRGLLAHSPIAQGVHQFYMTSTSAVGSSLEADRIGIVLSFIHFYNACCQCGITTVQWRDLDYLIDTYGAEHLFMGGLPKTLQPCALKYRLVFGESLQLKSKDLTLCRLKSLESRRPFGSRATPLTRLLWARIYDDCPTKHTLLLKHTELVLAEIQRQGKLHRINIDATGQLLNGNELKQLNKHSPPLSHEEFLDAVKDQLNLELKHLDFDFFALSRRCIGMLTKILDELAESGVDSHLRFMPNRFSQHGPNWDSLMEPIVLAETFSQYALMKELQGLHGNTEMPYISNPDWVDQAEARFKAVARGMEKGLLKMKEDGVKDLCDAVGWTGPSKREEDGEAAANHSECMNDSKGTSGSKV